MTRPGSAVNQPFVQDNTPRTVPGVPVFMTTVPVSQLSFSTSKSKSRIRGVGCEHGLVAVDAVIVHFSKHVRVISNSAGTIQPAAFVPRSKAQGKPPVKGRRSHKAARNSVTRRNDGQPNDCPNRLVGSCCPGKMHVEFAAMLVAFEKGHMSSQQRRDLRAVDCRNDCRHAQSLTQPPDGCQKWKRREREHQLPRPFHLLP